MRFDLFVRIVDNFGDAGVCWRLARQLVAECGAGVRLWIDDPICLHRLWPAVDPCLACQIQAGVEIRAWPAEFPPVEPLDVVVEAFGCRLPEVFVAAMAARTVPPVWINLEYLSAEDWVEGCHTLPSPHPRLPLTKYFFFPGFTARTGGLLREADLAARRDAFRAEPRQSAALFTRLGLAPPPESLLVSLFCYANATLPELVDAWAGGGGEVVCLLPAGSRPEVHEALGLAAEVGAVARRGRLRAQVIPFLDQDEYERLLWACDVNFVRGEDSFVRAQWAARPFVWQAYPQEGGAHRAKLTAFLDRYFGGVDATAAAAARALFEAWNGVGGLGDAWPRFAAVRPALTTHAVNWDRRFAAAPGLAAKLAAFCRSKL